jgi:hypothetical protein
VANKAISTAICSGLLFNACYVMRKGSAGGDLTTHRIVPEWAGNQLVVNPADVARPDGYRIQAITTGLTFPTGATTDDQNRVYVVESGYSYGETFTTPRLLRIDADGKTIQIAAGSKGPWSGVVFYDRAFYATQGGELNGGAVLRITPDGRITPLVSNLPSMGDHHTNAPAVGPGGSIHFAQGTATNSGVAGEDNFNLGCLKRKPQFHDIPCQDIKLSGESVASKDVLERDRGTVRTAPFPAFARDGKFYATDNRNDDRGSRPVWVVR